MKVIVETCRSGSAERGFRPAGPLSAAARETTRPAGPPGHARDLGRSSSVEFQVVSEAEELRILGVDYWRFRTRRGGELYLTSWGLPFRKHLDPGNWYAPEWFVARRERLVGTSAIYRVATQPVDGRALDLVVRFSRVGLEVPLDTLTICRHPHAEFNSPFEEFARVTELRSSSGRVTRGRLLTKRPLALYIPPERFEPWQTGRKEHKIAAKQARHPEVSLDLRRQYILLYGWIDGQNAVETAAALGLESESRSRFLTRVTQLAIEELEDHGFRMLDIKPEHVLLRFRRDGALLRRHDGQPAYALVDYELLEPVR